MLRMRRVGAGLYQGTSESAGKRMDRSTTKGNRYLRRALALLQGAWGATRKKDCFLQRTVHRLVSRLEHLGVDVTLQVRKENA